MTEPEIVFHERLEPDGPDDAGRRRRRAGVAIAAGTGVILALGAAAAMGASPAPAASPAASPTASASPETGRSGPSVGGFGLFAVPGGPGSWGVRGGGPSAGLGLGGVTITAISGSDLSLRTEDGWTRTITVGTSTTITKGGTTVAVGDLALGDEIRFAESRQDDGTYAITRIQVILPTVFGSVTAKSSDSLTLKERDGSAVTIHLSGDTTYQQAAGSASLGDVSVGDTVVVEGAKRSDGSLDAAVVHLGVDRGVGAGPWDGQHPDAHPAPSASPSTSSSQG